MTYRRKIVRAVREGLIEPGEVAVVEVRHDDGCRRLRGGARCDCDCELYLRGRRLDLTDAGGSP